MMNDRNTQMINGFEHIPYHAENFTIEQMIKRSSEFYDHAQKRRSLRYFSDRSFPKEVIQNIIKSAGTAPSGANKQPWTFCLISNPEIKKEIRIAAEKEEYEAYNGRMSEEWLKDLKPFGTDWKKPFLEKAPYIIAVFRKIYDVRDHENKSNNYYVNESIGLACGILLSAIQHAGLVALTHTPSPMNFLARILNRPKNEKPFLLIPVGFPDANAYVPNISRKELDEICVDFE